MDKFLSVALEASKNAEKVIMKYYSDEIRATFKPDQTPVTIADKEAERIIIETIKKIFPDHDFLGEESGTSQLDSEYLWLIDPIDGTNNYIRKLPFFGTEIALMKGKKFILGVSNGPALNETAHAFQGGGAFINGKMVHVSKIDTIREALVCYGNIKYFSKTNSSNNIIMLANDARYTRGYGDFWMYYLLAQGKIDIVAEAKLKIWDIAACKVIVEEAGGKITDMEGNKVTTETTSIIATNGKIHDVALSYFNR